MNEADTAQLAPVSERPAVIPVVAFEVGCNEFGSLLLLLDLVPALMFCESLELVDDFGLRVRREAFVERPDPLKGAWGLVCVVFQISVFIISFFQSSA